MKNVVIYTHSGDQPVWEPVAAALHTRGAQPWILSTDRFPIDFGLVWSGPGEGYLDLGAAGRLSLSAIDAVWFRRDAVGRGLPASLPEDVRRASATESRGVLRAALLDTPAFLLDPPALYARARNKALQMVVAREAGVRIPQTIETNDPEEARDFIAGVGGAVIAKMHADVRLQGGTVYTNVLGPGDVEALDELAGCPMILQEAIPKARELRVVCAGRRLFAVSLENTELEGAARDDWRRAGLQTLNRWRPYTLPASVHDALQRFYDQLGMNYSSADLIVTPDGEHVLLESNGVGESFWLYDHHPLADSLAEVLLGTVPRRPVPPELR